MTPLRKTIAKLRQLHQRGARRRAWALGNRDFVARVTRRPKFRPPAFSHERAVVLFGRE